MAQELELLISRIMEEASSDPALEVLLYEDFVKVRSCVEALHCGRVRELMALDTMNVARWWFADAQEHPVDRL